MSLRRHGGGATCRGSRAAGVAEQTTDVLRLVRAGVFAAVCVVTTSLGHALMSGDVLPWWAVVLAFAGTASGAWWLTGRERGAATVVGATVVAQGLLHLLFSLAHRLVHASATASAEQHASGTQAMTVSHSGMVMHHSGADMVMHHHGMMGESSGAPLTSSVMHGTSARMLLAHLLAAVVCGLWLWRGEAAVHRLGRALAAVLFAPLRRVCRVLFRARPEGWMPSGRAAVGDGALPGAVPSALRHTVVRRGPPWGRPAVSRPSPDQLLTLRS
ncbi:hypothetical protein [Streptomyces sp. NBC_00996]|uniref:hypothetical protein n=1 Tax=Streptomyces sp. NBC_00996 TaxID=2903710 RepID=UPI003864B7D2|nr:hypothetical protein OG390_44055 [Streptomyces sp. NBC_00996]